MKSFIKYLLKFIVASTQISCKMHYEVESRKTKGKNNKNITETDYVIKLKYDVERYFYSKNFIEITIPGLLIERDSKDGTYKNYMVYNGSYSSAVSLIKVDLTSQIGLRDICLNAIVKYAYNAFYLDHKF